eukprot:jgi/Antlo1/1712/1570
MITQRTKRDGSASLLRDKYMTEYLKEALENAANYPKISELGGVKYILPRVQELVMTPLLKTEEYASFGQEPHRGVIFHGVSGAGKTYLAHCIAREMQLPIIKCPISCTKEIREAFRKVELLKPALILMDNVDQLFREDNGSEIEQISESLRNMSRGILAIATAQSLTRVDERLKMFNGFETHVLVKIPDVHEREEIIRYLTKEKLNVNYGVLAKNTPGLTPSDLARLVRCAATKSIASNRLVITQDILEEVISENRSFSGITFDDIGALDKAKEALRMSVVLPSLHPDTFRKMGISKASGVLLHGPPGCGKTMLAKAVSNMSHCNFISVRGPELISKYVGDSEKEIRLLFERARALSPCVVFFDEIDSICSKRTSNSFGNRIVNQVLTLLDGLENRGSVFVIAATNRLRVLDKALLRPGRFDKIVEVPYPSVEECRRIFCKIIEKLPVEKVNVESLFFENCSGADIYGIVQEAAISAIKRDPSGNSAITQNDIEAAISNRKNSKTMHC